jgi:CubicO group peptidase (beta-lactamase class C family)
MPSKQATALLNRRAGRLGLAALIVLDSTSIIFQYGEIARPYPVHSIRKSLLNAIFGKAVTAGLIDLDADIGSFGIDDDPQLTRREQRATVRHLLCARSGVYLPAPAGQVPMANLPPRPSRGAFAPGEFWSYNNWDFNVAGNIYERATQKSIFVAFDREVSRVIGMEDLNIYEHCNYVYKVDSFGGNLRYPNYAFELSARDLGRFGQLYLRKGDWGGSEVVAADWISMSTAPISRISGEAFRASYGSLWWVGSGEAQHNPGGFDSFSAIGYGGSHVTVVPDRDRVIVALVDTGSSDFKPVPDRDYGDLLESPELGLCI